MLLVRSKPARATASGEVLVRLARQLDLLTDDALDELGAEPVGDRSEQPSTVALAVNADSLATWLLPALAPLAGSYCFDLHVVDQDHTSALLRDGTVMAAVTSQAQAVPGCRSTRLGAMRYRPMAAPGFAQRWFPDGVSAAALAHAPNVEYDRTDELQQRYLRRRTRAAVSPPVHHVPSSGDFLRAVRLGFGWGMALDLESAADELAGTLVARDPRAHLDVVLHWQQWRLRSASGPRRRRGSARGPGAPGSGAATTCWRAGPPSGTVAVMTSTPRFEPVHLPDALASFSQLWSPRVALRVNDYDVRVAKVAGDHVWHTHDDTDEFFLVLDGELVIDLREDDTERRVVLPTGSAYVVPRGQQHRPSAPTGASILMFEPTGTLSTGDHEGALPGHVDATTGHALG